MDLTRRITREDTTHLRAIRLRALLADPLAFGSTYEREVSRDSKAWEDWASTHAAGPDKATFLVFRDATQIGIAAGMRVRDVTFGLFSMWVAPEVRRTGIGRKLVEHVIDWATKAAQTASSYG